MHRWVFMSALVFTAKSTAIHNQEQDHQTLYSRLHAQQQQQQHDSLITPLKLQYVAPKSFLTSAALVAGQQVLTTANPQLIPQTNSQPLTNARHLQMVNSQLATNPELISARNPQFYQPENQQILTQNPQQLSAVNHQPEFVSARNPQYYPIENQQVVPATLQQSPLINQQIIPQHNSELSQRNYQHIPTVNPLIQLLNPQLLTNADIIASRNSQLVTTANPQYITPTINPQQLVTNQQISPRNPQYFTTATPQLAVDNQQLISVPQQTNAPILPLLYAIQSAVDNQQRYNRLPATNAILPELQFVDQRSHRVVIPNAQITSLLNALYQPSYLLMAMPPSSYTAVSYYDEQENNQDQEVNPVQSDSPQSKTDEDDDRIGSKSNIVQRSNSDTASQSDSSENFPESSDDALKVSYKDNHVKYSY